MEKRKRRKRKKWYVVLAGVKPGVYETWDDCLLIGQPLYNQCKSFYTKEEAEQAYQDGEFKKTLPQPKIGKGVAFLTVEEVNKLLAIGKRNRRGYVPYTKEVEQMSSGQGFVIHKNDWKRKTDISAYFSSTFNMRGRKVIRTTRLLDGNMLVIKL